MCQNNLLHETVHFANAETHIWVDNSRDEFRQRLREKMYKQGKPVAHVQEKNVSNEHKLSWQSFIASWLAPKSLSAIGFLDKAFYNTKEHFFCISVAQAQGIVTYVPSPP